MPNQSFYLPLKQFFNEIYQILKNSEKAATEIWCELYEINFLKQYHGLELNNLINNFEFISIKKGSYTNYYSINKVLFIIDAINILKFDIKKLSSLIDYTGFEYLIQEILLRNSYKAIQNFRFSDKSYFKKKTNQSKYEIDVIGFKQNYLLLIDAKQWKKRDVYSSINKAANLQFQRALALQKNPEIFSKLIQSLTKQRVELNIKLPILIIPLMVTFEENYIKFNENSVPLVSIYRFNSFLQDLRKNLSFFKILKMHKISIQEQII